MKLNTLIILFLFSGFVSDCFGQDLYAGYTDKLSYRALEEVTFFISGNNQDNFNYHLVPADASPPLAITGFNNTNVFPQPMQPNEPWKNGYGYLPCSNTWTVPAGFKSGRYQFRGNTNFNSIPIIIKDPSYPTAVDIIVVIATNTINAYTLSGGKSLYYDCTGDPNNCLDPLEGGLPATTVSFRRPMKLDDYGHVDDGFLKWILTWAPTRNYKIGFIADYDLEDYNEIANAKLIIITGHSEYWTRKARLNFDKFVDSGKDALVLSGNTMWWQVRYSNDDFSSEPPNNDPTIMTCHRGVNWLYDADPFDPGPNPSDNINPLLATYHWGEPTLKYSILGSIGSDWLRGGVGVTNTENDCYGGFNGHKIILASSPILQGLGFINTDVIKFATGEYDGTLVKRDANGIALDINGHLLANENQDPVLDVSALGFYRAEMIAYDKTKTDYPDPLRPDVISYCPLMVFQKTGTSGTVINVNSNHWCADWGIGITGTNPQGNPDCAERFITPDSRIPLITAKMITLMMTDQNNHLNGNNLFSSLPPVSPAFIIKPAYTNVSYNACSEGSVKITPKGVYLTEGYKVDHGFTWDYSARSHLYNNIVAANIDANCIDYNEGRHMTSLKNNPITTSTIKEKPFEISSISITPNPNNGTFQIAVTKNNRSIGVKELKVYDMMGNIVWSAGTSTNNQFNIDISEYSSGIYYVRSINELGEMETKKIIKQ